MAELIHLILFIISTLMLSLMFPTVQKKKKGYSGFKKGGAMNERGDDI